MITKKANITIESYISSFPKDIQKLLDQVRKTIKKAAPEAKEKISYGMPTFELEGNVVHFAAFKNHIGFYPTPSGLTAFKKDLAGYKGSKGAVQFPLDEPIPFDLIDKITKFRVKENLERAHAKNGFLSLLSGPARRALENNGITTLKELSKCSEKEILSFHGMGPASLPKLRQALKAEGLGFKV